LAKDLDGLAGLLAKAEEKLKASAENLEESEKKLAAESLLEVQGPKGLKGLAGKVKAGIGGALKAFSNWWNRDCNEDCKALKAYSAKNYIKNRQDDAAVRGQPVTLTKIFTDNLASMAKRLSHMEDVAKRYSDLHAHDVNLHQEIMAQIDAQFKDVKDKMKVIEAQIAAFETKRATNQALIEKLNKELQSMMQAQNEKISSEKRMIEKNNKDTKNLISRMELLAVRVGVVAKQNAACKAGVEMLKKDVASKKKEQELIEKKQKELEGKLAAVEKETQRVKDKSSEHQAKLESELQQVEDERKETDENIQRFTEDLSDGKAKGKAMMAKTKENGNQQEANEKALKKKKDAKNDALDSAFD
jgi:DNA repair exonuclease SbcCD ATPase subunit